MLPKIYHSHIAMVSSIYNTSRDIAEVRCDTLMEEFDISETVIDSETNLDLLMAGLVELQREHTTVSENSFLVKMDVSFRGYS